MKIKAWIHAARLRTLPLSISGILVGSGFAWRWGGFELSIFIWLIITTLLLQVLSNFANDYGDFSNGIDNNKRVGPTRSVQSGAINASQMKRAIVITSSFSFLSGICLIYTALGKQSTLLFAAFLLLGILAILAALKYTIGKNPFGYRGFGDIMVFLFFGLISVVGSSFLYLHSFKMEIWLPAISIGLLSTGVLNINNMRDIENDRHTGKNTLIVKMGSRIGKGYHAMLISGSMICTILFFVIIRNYIELIYTILPFGLLILHLRSVFNISEPKNLDPELKHLSMTTLLLAVCISIALVF